MSGRRGRRRPGEYRVRGARTSSRSALPFSGRAIQLCCRACDRPTLEFKLWLRVYLVCRRCHDALAKVVRRQRRTTGKAEDPRNYATT